MNQNDVYTPEQIFYGLWVIMGLLVYWPKLMRNLLFWIRRSPITGNTMDIAPRSIVTLLGNLSISRKQLPDNHNG